MQPGFMPTASMRYETVTAHHGLSEPLDKTPSSQYQNGFSNGRVGGASKTAAFNEKSKKFLEEFFHREPCLYSHRVYQYATDVFDVLKHESKLVDPIMQRIHGYHNDSNEKKELPQIEFESENEKRLTYQLVFATLKYQAFLEEMLEDCAFFSMYPEYKDEQSLVTVMLSDFKQRKFQARNPLSGEMLDPALIEVEQALLKSKTKFNAILARKRIKAQVLSIDELLPQSIRNSENHGSNIFINCWINQLKTGINSVLLSLEDEGFQAVYTERELRGQVYLVDHQCGDTLWFPTEHRLWLEKHSLVREGHLVIQDKSSCVGPECVPHLLNEGDDVLQVNVGSGLSTAHLASLTHHMDSTIYAFGLQSEKQHNQVTENLDRLGARGRVKLIAQNLLDVDLNDERLKHIKVALLSAECSRSAVNDPINFLVSEGESMEILRDLTKSDRVDSRVADLSMKHSSLLRHVLRFPRIQAVIYHTRSNQEAENEGVVSRSLEFVNTVCVKKSGHFRVTPPVLPLGEKDIEGDGALCGKFLKFPASTQMSGCFVATITREADDPKEAARDVLARAAAKGLITGVPPEAIQKTKSAPKKSIRKKDKGPKQQHPKRSKSQPDKECSQRIPALSGGHNANKPMVLSQSVPDTPLHKHTALTTRKKPTPTTPGSSTNKNHAITPIQMTTTPICTPTQMLQPQIFPSPVPYELTKEQRQPQRPASPPPHRKVVQHPKPFSYIELP